MKFPILKTIAIKDAGYDESLLQDMIWDNPSKEKSRMSIQYSLLYRKIIEHHMLSVAEEHLVR
jgi:hypothetical protein